MADPAENFNDEPGDNKGGTILQMPGVEAVRRTEGGLSLHFTFDIPKLPTIRAFPRWTHQQLTNGGLMVAVVLLVAAVIYQHFTSGSNVTVAAPAPVAVSPLRPDVATDFNPSIDTPVVGPTTYVDQLASVIGSVNIGDQVFVGPFASIRGDEGQPIVIGDGSNVQDSAVIHAFETFDKGRVIDKNLVTVGGNQYAVWIGMNVSIETQAQVHGPAAIGDNTWVGMQALVLRSTIGKNVVIEPGARVIGVVVADGRYVPAGAVITTQPQADALPKITSDYQYGSMNVGVLHVNQLLADGYRQEATGKGTPVPPAP
jgi:carbonic anhydrase/acetyltransferase-like protein (isoleucine patch superfamily)